jgi:hypothetical protein
MRSNAFPDDAFTNLEKFLTFLMVTLLLQVHG